ncbi:MAG: HTTM domain-containing protein [Flavobacteriales bacterium]|uniref:HTTM domain-containing protein n=1 Tax=Candidatus Ulvibacter alkanivorans TaxID=2267620 RepID=UPI000DF3D34C|nr:HTTM domain-containing protein [Candidatus Ulvibacter alkanivorans]MCH2489727.1 HTTM domain-containing protein [Flavobacteriales bacterium]
MQANISTYLAKKTEAAPLAVFRIFFGLMMFASIVRFWANGWIEKLYLEPDFHFKYYGFEWVQPLGELTYLLFVVCALSALMIAIGYRYRIFIVLFFLSFTYIELMDKTTYLNHYYFISCLAFLLLLLPANVYYAVDAKLGKAKTSYYVPAWTIDSIKILLCIVYFYAGLAKLNSDWLVEAMPLKIWLPSKYDLPLLGDVLQQEWLHYAFSWSGAVYDLAIPFLLLWRKTRWFGFVLVVLFHLLTRALFPIGMFPYIMIVSALIFFDPKFHHKILNGFSKLIGFSKIAYDNVLKSTVFTNSKRHVQRYLVLLFLLFQLVFPWRYLAYSNELFWTEEGYRFSWRVMLMEKAGYAQFKVVDTISKKQFYVDNSDFLSPLQEKQMSTQPDFILEYAHFLGEHFKVQGHKNLAVYVESYVALNGRLSQPYIDPTTNLLEEKDSFKQKDFILPFNDNIKGL